jgi:acyl-CoA hydrolase
VTVEPHDLIGLRRRAFPAERDLSPRPPSVSRTVIVEPMEIIHASIAGFVHGGTIMRLVDTAGGIAAGRHCGGPTVTASMDEMSFLASVHIGDLVTVRAQVNDTGRTSMEVGVRVEVEIPGAETVHVSTAHLVFVALDENRRPVPVPPLVPETDEERQRQAEARIRRQQRLLRKEALRQAGNGAGDAAGL